MATIISRNNFSNSFFYAKRTTDVTGVGAGSDTVYDSPIAELGDNISYNSSTGVFTLQPNYIYKLVACNLFDTFSNSTEGCIIGSWHNGSNVELSDTTRSTMVPTTFATDSNGVNPYALCIHYPTSQLDVKFRLITCNGTANLMGHGSFAYVEQLG